METFYTIARIENGKKLFFSEYGWIPSRKDAVWFSDKDSLQHTVENLHLNMSDIIIGTEEVDFENIDEIPF